MPVMSTWNPDLGSSPSLPGLLGSIGNTNHETSISQNQLTDCEVVSSHHMRFKSELKDIANSKYELQYEVTHRYYDVANSLVS